MRKSFRKTVHEIAFFSRADDWDVMHIWFVCVCLCEGEVYTCRLQVEDQTLELQEVFSAV